MLNGATLTDESCLCCAKPTCCCLARQETTSCHPTLSFISHLGKMIFSLGSSEAKSLKVLNLTGGGWRKGLAPKLNSHCWYDIKLAAAKKPELQRERNEINVFVWSDCVCVCVYVLTWLRKRPVSLVAADAHSDRRSSAFCWGPTGSQWHLLNKT